ncbi:MAG: zinc ribbon domain-containing protein [Chloroflexota bacterium]|nr:zinc ribbon domain-containing protein [Chloroflexota bacterium]
MADLPATLGEYFRSSHTRTLASLAPLGVVAGAAGLIIGAAVATPVFAAAGLGLVLTSVAANIASSLVYDLVKPDLDAGERELRIAEGLKQRDPGVIQLVAEALASAGPDVARAIPDQTRAALIDTLGQGMQAPGGALAAIAPRYTAGLAAPQTNWEALQAELRQTIKKISQTIEASEGGVVSGGHMQAEATGGSVDQVMRTSGTGSRIENSSQFVSGARVEQHRCLTCGATVPAGQPFCGNCGAAVPGA